MRTYKIILVLVICSSSIKQLHAKTKLSIKTALEKQYIKAKAICKGGLELNYTLSSMLKDSLVLSIPAGWRFNSNDPKNDYQDILVTHEQIFVFKALETKKVNIKGYCCEATKSGPIEGILYTVGKLADSNLVKLARFINKQSFDKNTEQYSVWAVSDNKETANITSVNDSLTYLLRSFVAQIKGEPLPWYTLLKRANVSSRGTVSDHPVRFKADFNYAINKICYSYCYITDTKGNKVSEVFGTWLYPENNEYKASFNVAQLKKGNYKLVLVNQEQSLFEKEFKI